MKNQGVWLLLTLEILLLALLIGFFLGRNTADQPIQISKIPEETEVTAASDMPAETHGKININTANSEELQKLPGIGPTLAERIVAYREKHGPFQALSELTNVEGIGLEKLNKLIDFATVE